MRCYEDIIPMFRPCSRLIASITTAVRAVVVTQHPHGYTSGIVIRFFVPDACGMPEINELTSEITVIDPTSFYVEIDTTAFKPFVIPTVFLPTPGGIPEWVNICAQIIPVGDASVGEHADETNLAPKNINRKQQGYYNNVPMKDWR